VSRAQQVKPWHHSGFELPLVNNLRLRERVLCDGCTLVPNVVDADSVHVLRREMATLVDEFYDGLTDNPDYWSYLAEGGRKRILYRIHNLEKQPDCPTIVGLFEQGHLHDLAAECLGESAFPTVCAAVIKLPHVGAPVPWHRDRDKVGPGRAVNISLYLHDSVARNGCLEIVPGSHTQGADIDPDQWRRNHPVLAVTARPGDATVHDVRLAHGSGTNSTDTLCVRIVMEFRAASLPAAVLLDEE